MAFTYQGKGLVLAGTALALAFGLAAGSAAAQQDTGQAEASQQQGQNGGDQVTLNLKDADIRALIETVSDATGRNFIIDPRVKGRVTVISSRPMDAEALYETFLSILEVNGYAAIEGEDVTKIVPEVDAKQFGGDSSRTRPSPPDDIVTRVIRVDNMPAAQLVPILRPLVPQYGHLAAYPPANMLIISDRQANVDRLTALIGRIDASQDQDIEVVRLENANANEVTRILTSLLQNQQASEGGIPVTVLADPRTNSVLLSGDQERRARLVTLIERLDQPLEQQGDTRVIYLSYADAEQMAELLKTIASGQQARQQGEGEGAQVGGGGGEVQIVADQATNAIVVDAPPETMGTLRMIVRQLDIRRAQVLVESIIAEITSDRSADFGVQWAADGTPDDSPNTPAALSNFGDTGSIVNLANNPEQALAGLQGLTLGVGRLNDDQLNFAVLLRALSGDATTNVLSTPTLTTLDNQEAEITVGQEVPFVTGQFTSNQENTVNPFQTIERKDVGIKLKITPQINEGNAVELAIEQEVSSVSTTAQTGTDVVTNKRTLTTNVIVEDQQTLVLGGLIDEDLQESEQRVPLLGSIPILGHLFRFTSVDKIKRNLMVFIRPSILRDGVDTARYTSQKYDYMRLLQRREGEEGVPLMPSEGRPQLPPIDLRKAEERADDADRGDGRSSPERIRPGDGQDAEEQSEQKP